MSWPTTKLSLHTCSLCLHQYYGIKNTLELQIHVFYHIHILHSWTGNIGFCYLRPPLALNQRKVPLGLSWVQFIIKLNSTKEKMAFAIQSALC